ncbi:MAG: class I SAM-dependent methyltransferase [Candidatus Moranbacteria bacterium]|nr:class I SAM-dependent methyltransferase [Candidatus Moranbacteria bacterium]
MEEYESSYTKKNHFSFGKNWSKFLKSLNDEKIDEAKKSLIEFFGETRTIKGKTFIDIGCGSGLFSLAAYLLGAEKVVSVDVDRFSVSCAKYLREKSGNPNNWKILQGSALDESFIKSLGKFDIVYSWGVLHHTGDMYRAFGNVINLIKDDGIFYLAIYNKFEKRFRGGTSRSWLKIKKIYNKSGNTTKQILNLVYATYLLLVRSVLLENPGRYIKEYKTLRGMDFFTDVKDWLGGYPYEFATVDEIADFFKKKGLLIEKVKPIIGTGCNEFLLKK